jgi:hypothetical protein
MTFGGPDPGFGQGVGVTLDRGRTPRMPTESAYTWGGAFNTHGWNARSSGGAGRRVGPTAI